MARFILTAQIQMRAPTNSQLNAVSAAIKRGLSGINVDMNVNVPVAQQRALSQVANSLKTVRQQAQLTTNSFEAMGQALSQNIRRYGSFTIATGAFIRLGIAIRRSVGEAIDFETEIRKIAQGQQKTISYYDGLKKEIDSLSTTLGVSSLELASNARILAQAGLTAGEVKLTLEGLAKSTLAPTFGDMSETGESLIAIFRQFNLTASQTKEILGSINQVSADFAVESEDIASAIRLAGASFSAASNNADQGIESFRQFISLFTSVRQTTRGSPESIATGLRTIITRLQRGGTIEYFRSLGVQLTDSEGKFIGAYHAIQKISEALENLDTTDVKFSQIAELLGGYRQIDKTIPLLRQFAVAQKAYESSVRGQQSLDEGLGLAMETLAQQFARVRSQFDSLIRKLTESSAFRDITKLVLNMASALIKVTEALIPLLPYVGTIFALKIGGAIPSIARGFAQDYRKVVGRKDGGLVKFAKGGLVGGTGNTDSVPVNLEDGQYVLRKKAVQALQANSLVMPGEMILSKEQTNSIGISNLNRINNFDRYADGGYVGLEKFASGGPKSFSGVPTDKLEKVMSDLFDEFVAKSGKYAEKAAIDLERIRQELSRRKLDLDKSVVRTSKTSTPQSQSQSVNQSKIDSIIQNRNTVNSFLGNTNNGNSAATGNKAESTGLFGGAGGKLLGAGFLIQTFAEVGRNFQIFGKNLSFMNEGMYKATTAFGELVTQIGFVTFAYQNMKGFLPKGIQDKLTGVEGNIGSKVLGKAGRFGKVAGGGIALAGLASYMAGEYFSSKGDEELKKNNTGTKGLDKKIYSSGLGSAGGGAALGFLLGGPIGALLGGTIGYGYGALTKSKEAKTIIENRDEKKVSDSLGRINNGSYKNQDISNLKNKLSTYEGGYGFFSGDTNYNSERVLNKEELETKGITKEVIENAFKNVGSKEQLKSLSGKQFTEAAENLGITKDQQKNLASLAQARLKEIERMQQLKKVIDQSSVAMAQYAKYIDTLSKKIDAIQATNQLVDSHLEESRSGTTKARDFSSFFDLAGRGVNTPQYQNILNSNPNTAITQGVQIETVTNQLVEKLLYNRSQQATTNPLDAKGSVELANDFRTELAKAFPNSQGNPAIRQESAKFEAFLRSKFGGSEERQTDSNYELSNAFDIIKLAKEYGEENKNATEYLKKWASAVEDSTARVANFAKEITQIQLDSISKRSQNKSQYNDSISRVAELRDKNFNYIGVAGQARANQLGEIGNVGNIGTPSGNSIKDVNGLIQVKNNAENQLALTRADRTNGNLTEANAAAELEFSKQLQTANAALEVFANNTEYAAALERQAGELKQRRQAAGSTAIDYLTGDASNRRRQQKALSFASQLGSGQINNISQLAGNREGVELFKQIRGEKEFNQTVGKIPGLDKLFNPSVKENIIHKALEQEAQARLEASNALSLNKTAILDLNQAMLDAAKNLKELFTPQGFQQVAQQNAQNNNVVTHNVQFAPQEVVLRMPGLESISNSLRPFVEDLIRNSVNRWWEQQQTSQNKVNMGPEHQAGRG